MSDSSGRPATSGPSSTSSLLTDDRVGLVLIHGLGATPGVWDPAAALLLDRWAGPILMPALPGHGRASWTGDYTVPALATAVASEVSLVSAELTGSAESAESDHSAGAGRSGGGPAGEPAGDGSPPIWGLLIVGHSLGGAVGLELASGRYAHPVLGVLALGVKTTWTDDDVAGMAKVAERGVRWFPTRDEATARFLRQAGLEGVTGPGGPVGPDHPAVIDAVVEGVGPEAGLGWRVAQDPASFAQRPVDMAALLDAARCPTWIGAGAGDAMATEAELSAYVDSPHIAPGRGHNVQVEDPAWAVGLVEALAATVDGVGRNPPDPLPSRR